MEDEKTPATTTTTSNRENFLQRRVQTIFSEYLSLVVMERDKQGMTKHLKYVHHVM